MKLKDKFIETFQAEVEHQFPEIIKKFDIFVYDTLKILLRNGSLILKADDFGRLYLAFYCMSTTKTEFMLINLREIFCSTVIIEMSKYVFYNIRERKFYIAQEENLDTILDEFKKKYEVENIVSNDFVSEMNALNRIRQYLSNTNYKF